MQTGEKVARLLAEEETEEQRKARILESIRNIKDDLKDSPKVQKALNIVLFYTFSPNAHILPWLLTSPPKVEGTGKTKWRSMEELKKELKAGEMKISEDYITMKELVARFEQEETEEVGHVPALGWLVKEVKEKKKKKEKNIFPPLMTLGNESPKEFCF